MKDVDEWLERDNVMTEAESRQCERAIKTLCNNISKSLPLRPPSSY